MLPYFDFDMDKVKEYALMRNPELKIFPICSKTGEGVDGVTGLKSRQGSGLQKNEAP